MNTVLRSTDFQSVLNFESEFWTSAHQSFQLQCWYSYIFIYANGHYWHIYTLFKQLKVHCIEYIKEDYMWMSYVNAIMDHHSHDHVLLSRNSQLNLFPYTRTWIKKGRDSYPYLACEHIWHSGQDYQMRFLRTSGEKKRIYFVKDSVIVLSSSSDTSVHVLQLELFKTPCKNVKMKVFASSQS